MSEPKPENVLRPIAAYFIGPRISREKIHREVDESGIQCEFFSTEAELELLTQNDRLFCVFVDLDVTKENTAAYLGRMRGSRLKWVVMARGLKMHQNQSIFSAGASDVLPHPVHPVTVKSRTRMLLIRYLKSNDMPEGTVLPSGVNAREGEKSDSNYVDGLGDNAYTHVSGDYSEKNSGRMLGGAHEKSDTNFQMVTGAPASENNGHRQHWDHEKQGYGTPPPSSENSKAKAGIGGQGLNSSEVHRPNASLSPNPPSAPSANPRHDQGGNKETSSRPAPALSPLSPPSPPRPIERSPDLARSEEFELLKTKMAAKTVVLTPDRKPDPARWPKFDPKQSPSGHRSMGRQKCFSEIQRRLSQVVEVVSPLQILLLSLRPHTLNEQLPPNEFYAIAHDGIKSEPKAIPVDSEFYPQVEIALEKTKMIAVNERSPQKIGQKIKPRVWMSGDDEEDASVVIPLYERALPFAVILMLFKEKISSQHLPLIEEAATVLTHSPEIYLTADFFGRLYRDAFY